jgi:hypothetical protein
MSTRQGSKHQLAEFTSDDLQSMVRQGPALRGEEEAAAGRPQSNAPSGAA